MIDPVQSRRRGLGRGLDVLMGPAAQDGQLAQLPVGSIKPNRRQPRRRLDADAVSELAESVRVQGVVQPVIVRPDSGGGYELIAGERRWRAARSAGLATIPGIIRDVPDRDSLLLALVENVAREDLSAVDEARAYSALIDEFELSLAEVAERVGRSKPAVSNRLRLLELSDDVLALVERGQLSEGHARAILSVPDHEERRRLARRIVRGGLSVRAAERAARWAGARTRPRRQAVPVDPELLERARGALERLTGAAVQAKPGRLEIAFADETELAELAEALASALAGPFEPLGARSDQLQSSAPGD
jgi:ParB family chromosome partitioning protein